jgi:hypothetical protein
MQKLTLTLSDKDYQAIEELAKKTEVSKTDVVRRAIDLAQWYETERAAGSKILVERPDGKLREVVTR